MKFKFLKFIKFSDKFSKFKFLKGYKKLSSKVLEFAEFLPEFGGIYGLFFIYCNLCSYFDFARNQHDVCDEYRT